jgi:hypothetical protein
MATGDNDNDVDGDGATGNEVDDDGDGSTGDDKDNDNDGDDDDNCEGNGMMGSGATGYDDDDDGDGRQQRRQQRWRDDNDNDANADDDGDGASDATTRGGMAGGMRRRVAIKNDGVNLPNIISYLAEVRFFLKITSTVDGWVSLSPATIFDCQRRPPPMLAADNGVPALIPPAPVCRRHASNFRRSCR